MDVVGLENILPDLNKLLIDRLNDAVQAGDIYARQYILKQRAQLNNDPVNFVKNIALQDTANQYGYSYSIGNTDELKNLLEKQAKFLQDNGVPIGEITPVIDQYVQSGYERYVSDQQTYGGGATKDLLQIAGLAAMFIPGLQGVGASIGAAIAPAANAAVQGAIGNAIVQGAISEATGGDFLKGAALSGLGSLAGGLQPGLSETLGGGAVGDIASKALIGGTMSELSGGDFAKGALISGVGAGIDQAKLSAADDYLSSLPGGHGPYSDAPVDMSDFDVAPPVIDTTFTPDYSLSVGAPVIPEMGAQGIQVPTINEVIDVVNQPVDYSLPIPGSGIGLVMPTAPNLDSMGGGQGITVPVSGGTLTESGVIPTNYVPDLGDPTSFINQPAPNVDVNIPELPEQTPENIDTELALLDVAKAVAPYVVTAALANEVINQPNQEQTGFPIVPVPADWKSPEYNMAFTPSAPIDFGTRELLRGTQFENPQITVPNAYSLSNLINTLNIGSVPFVQQNYEFTPAPFELPDILQQFNVAPTVGMTDVIGNLNDRPVSISDIIAGIQSGQNYSI